MKDVILFTAVFGPAFIVVAGVFVLGLCKAAARGDRQMERAMADYHEHCSAVDDDLTRLAHAYNSRHGKTFPRARGAHSGREGLLQPSATPDQQSDT
jgi:hypothetical protein